MKRGLLICIALAAVVVVAPFATGAEEECWFDLENCTMCKHLTAEKGLMDNMKWETHLIANGMLSVTQIAPGYEEAYKRAMHNMEQTGKELQSGQTMYLCNFCQSYGALLMAGAKFEIVETSVAEIDMLTSSDPALAEKIRTHAQRTIDEYKVMLTGGDHSGH